MPPKKVDKGQQKAAEKAKAKIVDDKTFGLKNKNKSKAVQKYIRSVQQQVTGGKVKSESELAAEQHAQKEAKKAAQRQAMLLASLYKGTENMKKLGADGLKKNDPKSIREGQAIDLYIDQREQKKPTEETIDDWDQAKLEIVIKTKHGAHVATTDIVCKYFLDALEKRLYGWFWVCPNGDACQYKHCLPPGYVLKPKQKAEDADEEDAEPIEEWIERQRAALPAGGTPVTLDTFKAWKERKAAEAKKSEADALTKAAEQRGQSSKGLSGRDLFAFNPDLFVDDAQAIDQDAYVENEAYWNEHLAEEAEQLALDAQIRRDEAVGVRDGVSQGPNDTDSQLPPCTESAGPSGGLESQDPSPSSENLLRKATDS